MHSRLILILWLCVALSGCEKKEEEVVETTPTPTVAHMDTKTAIFNCWGDSDIEINLEGEEVFCAVSDTRLSISPSMYQFDVVDVDYVQGVSLNDFGKAYWRGFQDTTKSDYSNGFTTETEVFKFIRTPKNSFIMIRGKRSLSDTVNSVYERFNNAVAEQGEES